MYLHHFQAHRHEVTICNYEAAANPADHKLESIIPQTNFISWTCGKAGGKIRRRRKSWSVIRGVCLTRCSNVKDKSNAAMSSNWFELDWAEQPKDRGASEASAGAEVLFCFLWKEGSEGFKVGKKLINNRMKHSYKVSCLTSLFLVKCSVTTSIKVQIIFNKMLRAENVSDCFFSFKSIKQHIFYNLKYLG